MTHNGNHKGNHERSEQELLNQDSDTGQRQMLKAEQCIPWMLLWHSMAEEFPKTQVVSVSSSPP